MNKLEVDNTNGTYLSVKQLSKDLNIGESTVRKLAVKAGADIHFGRCFRINREKLINYLENGAAVQRQEV